MKSLNSGHCIRPQVFRLTCQDAFGCQLHHGNQPPPRSRQEKSGCWRRWWPCLGRGVGRTGAQGASGRGEDRDNGAWTLRAAGGAVSGARVAVARGGAPEGVKVFRRQPGSFQGGDAAPEPNPAPGSAVREQGPRNPPAPSPQPTVAVIVEQPPPACPASSSSPLLLAGHRLADIKNSHPLGLTKTSERRGKG